MIHSDTWYPVCQSCIFDSSLTLVSIHYHFTPEDPRTLLLINFFANLSLKPFDSRRLSTASLHSGDPHSSRMVGRDTAPKLAARAIHSMICAYNLSSRLFSMEYFCPSSRTPRPSLVRACILTPETSKTFVAARRPNLMARCRAVSPCRLSRCI
jgi:hypothetical protein